VIKHHFVLQPVVIGVLALFAHNSCFITNRFKMKPTALFGRKFFTEF